MCRIIKETLLCKKNHTIPLKKGGNLYTFLTPPSRRKTTLPKYVLLEIILLSSEIFFRIIKNKRDILNTRIIIGETSFLGND